MQGEEKNATRFLPEGKCLFLGTGVICVFYGDLLRLVGSCAVGPTGKRALLDVVEL